MGWAGTAAETGAFRYMNPFWEYTELPDGGVRMRWVQDFEMRPGGHADDEGMTAHLNRTTREQQGHASGRSWE